MARLTGPITYLGSFKSIRHYRNLYDPTIFAGEKGGSNRNLILQNTAFVRTRENMTEFGGCARAVKSIRRAMQSLIPDQADPHFTGRLMRMTKEINGRDVFGVRGRRSILFSLGRPIISNLVLNDRVNQTEMLQHCYSYSHDGSGMGATLSIKNLFLNQIYIPGGATHYRIQNHLSLISDWTYSEVSRCYEPLSLFSGISANSCTPYTPVLISLTTDLVTTFHAGVVLSAANTIIQCLSIEFYIRSANNTFLLLKPTSVKVIDVF